MIFVLLPSSAQIPVNYDLSICSSLWVLYRLRFPLSALSAQLCSPAQLVLTNSKESHLHILTFANQRVLAHACVVLTMMCSVIKVPGVLLITGHRHSGLCRRSQDNRQRLFGLRHDSIAYSGHVLMRNTFSNVCWADCLVAEILNKRVTTQPKWLFYQGEVCL